MPVMTLQYVLIGRDVKLTWTPDANSTQDYYHVWYRGTLAGASLTWDQTLSNNTELLVTGLLPGERYDIMVIAASNGEMSPPKNIVVQIRKFVFNYILLFIATSSGK